MYKLHTLTRLHEAVMMVKDYKRLIELRYIHMIQVLEKYVKAVALSKYKNWSIVMIIQMKIKQNII